MIDIEKLNAVEKLLYKTLYKKDFYSFVKAFWNTADPSKFVDGKLIQAYCEIFQYMCRYWVGYEKKEITLPEKTEDVEIIDIREGKNKLCLMVPPRHTKSLIFNVFGPVWLWISNPIKAVSISHTGGLAGQMNRKRHAIINSKEFQFFFPERKLVTNTKGMMIDERGAELYSLNRNAFTGYGGDIIINDDLTNAETARKDQAEMANAWAYYQNTMPSRINNLDKCIIMNIQQRLAPNDVAGHIMNDPKLAPTYTFVTLPAIFQKTTYLVLPISGEVLKYEKGAFLWPERFGNYESLKADVGDAIFETQYLQNPIASDKTVIKEHMIIEKDIVDTPRIENANIIYAAHDFPVKDKDSSDFLGSILAYKVSGTVYITDCLEKKMAFVKSVEYVRHLDETFMGIIQIIEDKANGSPILQQLQDEVSGMQAFQPGTASKFQRLESASLYMNNIVFVKTIFNKLTNTYSLSEPLQNLKQRLLNFPFVEHDDIVDAFSMLILFIFMDRRFMVYGRTFNDDNVIKIEEIENIDYSTIFFNKEGDFWKVAEIAIQYGEESKLFVKREKQFKAGIDKGLLELKQFSPKTSLFIDCSLAEGLRGMSDKNVTIEKYTIDDFEKSVAQTTLAFAKKRILLDRSCVLTKSDIENVKFSKTKDETAKFASTKDGFVACLRTALHYYGGIV